MKTKAIILSLFLVGLIGQSFGQNNSGRFILGGETNLDIEFKTKGRISYSGNRSSGSYNLSNIFLSFNMGYYLREEVLIGMKPSYNDMYMSDYSFSPYVRYYFNNKNYLKPFVHLETGIGADNSSSSYKYEFGGGLTVFIHEKIAIDLALKYTNRNYTGTSSLSQLGYESSETLLKTSGLISNVGFVIVL